MTDSSEEIVGLKVVGIVYWYYKNCLLKVRVTEFCLLSFNAVSSFWAVFDC